MKNIEKLPCCAGYFAVIARSQPLHVFDYETNRMVMDIAGFNAAINQFPFFEDVLRIIWCGMHQGSEIGSIFMFNNPYFGAAPKRDCMENAVLNLVVDFELDAVRILKTSPIKDKRI